jgi:hypothetical protein
VKQLFDLLFRRDATGRHRLISNVATVELSDLWRLQQALNTVDYLASTHRKQGDTHMTVMVRFEKRGGK